MYKMKLLSPKFKCCIVDLLLLYCYVSIVLLIFYDYVNILSCMDDQFRIQKTQYSLYFGVCFSTNNKSSDKNTHF